MAAAALREIGVPSHYKVIAEKISELYPGKNYTPNHVMKSRGLSDSFGHVFRMVEENVL